MGIQINGNTNNINAGIGSLSIEDLNELDIVGVATAANFKTGVSNLHNVGLTLSGGQIDVGSNIKIGTAGVITATSFVGSGANLTGIAADKIYEGNTEAEVVDTGSDGHFKITTEGQERLRITSSGHVGIGTDAPAGGSSLHIQGGGTSDKPHIRLTADRGLIARLGDTSGGAQAMFDLYDTDGSTQIVRFISGGGDNFINTGGNLGIGESSSIDARLHVNSGTDNATLFLESTDGDVNLCMADNAGSCRLLQAGGNLRFRTGGNANAFGTGDSEKMVLDSNGHLMIGTTTEGLDTYGDILTLGSVGHAGMTIRSGSGYKGTVYFSDATSGAAEYKGSLQYDHSDDSMRFRVNETDKMTIGSDGNVHINMTDNGTASAKLNVENSSSVGANVLLISNKPSGANGKARLVFHTETSAGQGCSPYIQSLSGADAGPNANNNQNAGGLEFHTRSGGAGTDNNSLRLRDDGTFEKYGTHGNILLTSTGSSMEFTRGGRNQINATSSNGYIDFHTGGQYSFPAMRLFATPSVSTGAKVGINTDNIWADAQMMVQAQDGMPGLFSTYGMRIDGNSYDGNKRISNASGIYVIHTTVPANNTFTTVAIGRYHAALLTIRVGDASSKRTIVVNYDFTQPAYGVAHLNVITNNGSWNTGSADVQLTSSGSYDYAIQVKHNSYYNTSNTASCHMNFNVC